MANRWRKSENSDRLYLGLQNHCRLVTAATTLNDACCLGKKTFRKVKVAQSCLSLCDRMDYTVRGILQASCEKPRPHIKSRDITLLTEAHIVKAEVWCWSCSSSPLAAWGEEQTHWQSPWCWERLGAGGEGDDRGWDGCVASPTQWAWIEWTPCGSEGQGSLECFSPWGHKESDTT